MRDGVLVLGSGFLGSRMSAALVEAGHRVIVVTRSHPPGGAPSGAALELADLGAPETAERLRSLVGRVGAVVYAVGSLYPAETVTRPWLDLYSSLPPLFATLEAIDREPGARLLFLSSGGTVYGDHGEFSVAESACREPMSTYGISKLAAELYLAEHAARVGTSVTTVRVANAYGPGQRTDRGQGAVAAFLAAARSGRPVPFYGDGNLTRDYVHVDDVAAAVERLISQEVAPASLNLGTGVGTTLNQLRELVESVTGRPVPVERHPDRPIDLPYNVLDARLAERVVGWDPRPLDRGLADTWAVLAAEGSLP